MSNNLKRKIKRKKSLKDEKQAEKELQSKIKNKFFGYISSETGNFSNQNYTDKFYNSLSSKTKQSPQRLKTLMQIIASSR